MKKMLILVMFLSYGYMYSVENKTEKNEGTQYIEEYQEYQYADERDEFSQEYEQCVCDTVQVTKPSAITATLTNIGCTILVHYISLKSKLNKLLTKLKHKCAQWLYFYG